MTDTTSEVARVLGEHPGWRFRAEEPGDWYVCSGCGTELETLRSAFPQEFYDHQADMLAEAGLLRRSGTDHLAEDLRENTEALLTARAQVEAIRAAITREAAHGEAITRCNLVAERFQAVLDGATNGEGA